ncbi:penicillin acylase family protein [Gordonia jinghuaiqii]|uniref:Penicillin acylase family protein n=1 Tax=Gordonia jinghuaiqii TaxID=2758710 RepID=A0A7D7LTV4_9ACTN|nr:penicillin acylase family protein [Gordonia jinghuaiqii]MCR5980139.1 penicillin acylase family protein [Gordonia jinghuaiqii]QMT02097.1 penicillin acylase family protein [Gordonia jinghuaiqii]
MTGTPTGTVPASEILRDAHGIPHVLAATPVGALYGQGRACAQDRRWQIEFMRLRAEGRTAEVFGESCVEWDTFARRAQLDAVAKRIFGASSDRTRALITAYVDGVNSTLGDFGDRGADSDAPELAALNHRPEAWQPWTPISVFIMHHVLFGRFTTKLFRLHACRTLGLDALRFWDFETRDLDPTMPPMPDQAFLDEILALTEPSAPRDPAPAVDLGDPMSGSNAWGVGAARSSTGSPIVAGDPHRFLELPGIYQQFHLAATESDPAGDMAPFDVAGFAFAGVPGVPHFCQGDEIAWGITNAMGDYQDLYLERLSRDDAGVLVVEVPGGGRVEAAVHTEQITVRNAEPVAVEVITTPNGAIVFGGPDESFAMSLRSPMLSEDVTFDAPLDLLFARTMADVEAALSSWTEPVNRAVIAHADGSVATHVAGRVPVRASENYWLPVPGWEARHQWQGYEAGSLGDPDFDATTPGAGVTVTANQRMSDVPPLQPMTSECVEPFRSVRITELLDGLDSVSPQDCADIHADIRLEQAEVVQELLSRIRGTNAEAEEIRRRLVAWDTTMAADSTDAYLYAEFRTQLVLGVARTDVLAPLRGPHGFPAVFQPWFVPEPRLATALTSVVANTDSIGIDIEAVAVEALTAVHARIEALGTIPTWGSVHVLAPIHGFDLVGASPHHPELFAGLRPVPLPLAGDAECVFANAAAVGSHMCITGAAARYVWDLADPGASRWVVPLGACGDPRSDHFQDQAPLWARGELIDVVRDWDTLRAQASADHTDRQLEGDPCRS